LDIASGAELSLHYVSTGRREPQPSVPAFSCAWRSCRSSDTHSPLRSLQLRRRWTIHMELTAGTATKLSTVILVPAWTKNWTVCQSMYSFGRTLTPSIHHRYHHLMVTFFLVIFMQRFLIPADQSNPLNPICYRPAYVICNVQVWTRWKPCRIMKMRTFTNWSMRSLIPTLEGSVKLCELLLKKIKYQAVFYSSWNN